MVWHLKNWGEAVETPTYVPAYNGGHLVAAQAAAEVNTVGSLSDTQRSIVIGSLLGDGAMRCKTNALLEINHSATQSFYVDWKYRNLADLVRTAPSLRKGNGARYAYRFVTRSLPVLTPFYWAFYGSGRKTIPTDLEITPLALAVWFMDDGCRSRSALYLNTQQFDVQDQMRLLALLCQRYGIAASLNRDKAYHRIRVAVRSVSRFAELVEPYLLEQMSYKLPT